MSLNCLACTLIPRTDSYRENNLPERVTKLRALVARSWSGVMDPPDDSHQQCHDQTRKTRGSSAKIKPDHRRVHSASDASCSGSLEPRLVRSCGVRRNWTFEDLTPEDMDNRVEIH
ncbi:hypothetical protein K1719_017392 [Acacia pycnantha]|nr:hypothetical protein K1719_017392 [Acacia pycnantha]